jgi:TRAP-type C4-dicarboxylate transport system permease small subunit
MADIDHNKTQSIWSKPFETWLAAILAIGALLLFLSGSLLRTLAPSLIGGWVEEITIYLIGWALLLAAAGGVQTSHHVRTTFLVVHLPTSWQHAADILGYLASMVFSGLLVWMGWLVVDFALLLDERGPSILQIPKVYYYASLPIAMALMCLRYGLGLYRMIRFSDYQNDDGGHPC